MCVGMPLIIGLYVCLYATNYWIVCVHLYATNDWIVCAHFIGLYAMVLCGTTYKMIVFFATYFYALIFGLYSG